MRPEIAFVSACKLSAEDQADCLYIKHQIHPKEKSGRSFSSWARSRLWSRDCYSRSASLDELSTLQRIIFLYLRGRLSFPATDPQSFIRRERNDMDIIISLGHCLLNSPNLFISHLSPVVQKCMSDEVFDGVLDLCELLSIERYSMF